MRVLFVCTYDRPEFQRKVDIIANDQAIDLFCVIPDHVNIPEGRRISANGQRGYQILKFKLRQLGHLGDAHRQLYESFGLQVGSVKPDIIHCEHEQEGLIAAQVALARNIFAPGIPLVMYSWQNLLRKRSPPVLAVCRFTLRNAQHITCASEEAVSVLIRQGYVGTTDVSPMIGIDPALFKSADPARAAEIRASYGISANDFVMGFVGRLSPEKSVDTLLQAAGQMKTQTTLLIAGTGEMESSLKTLAHELGLANRCHFVGSVPNNAIPDFMTALDVLALPSLTTANWKEQFGRVLAEAMLCQRVVVGSNSGAIPEVIGQPECIFSEGNAAALATILERLAKEPATRKHFASAGHDRAMQRFTIDEVAQKNVKCWLNLASSHSTV